MFGKKFILQVVRDIVTTMCPTLIFGKKFIPKFVPIFVKKILLKVAIDIVTIMHPFIFGKISEICTNIWEEISSESFT